MKFVLEWFGTISLSFSVLALYVVLFKSLRGKVEIEALRLFVFVMIAGVIVNQLLFWGADAFDPGRTSPILKILWIGAITFFAGSVIILFSLITRSIRTSLAPSARSFVISIIFKFLVIGIGVWLVYASGVFNPSNRQFRSTLFTWVGIFYFAASVVSLGAILWDAINAKLDFIARILVYTVIVGIALGFLMMKLSG